MIKMNKKYELKFKKEENKVIVSGFKNKKQIEEFVKLTKVDWS